jgi:hypothetical protein
MRESFSEIKIRTSLYKITSKPVKAALKGTAFFAILVFLIACLFKIPYTNAYFSDRIISGDSGGYGISGIASRSAQNSGTAVLFFDVHQINLAADLDVNFAKDVLTATITIPESYGFYAEDVIFDSTEIVYGNESIGVSPLGYAATGNTLKLFYAWSEIEKYIGGSDNTPSFAISGKGAGEGKSGLGERFVFTGTGRIADLDMEFFVQTKPSCILTGDKTITIPTEENTEQVYSYSFSVNGNVIPAEEAVWRLNPEIPGVRLMQGELIVSSNTEATNITIEVSLNSNKYFTASLNIELVKDNVETDESTEEPTEESPKEPPENDGEMDDEDDDGDESEEDGEGVNGPEGSDGEGDDRPEAGGEKGQEGDEPTGGGEDGENQQSGGDGNGQQNPEDQSTTGNDGEDGEGDGSSSGTNQQGSGQDGNTDDMPDGQNGDPDGAQKEE